MTSPPGVVVPGDCLSVYTIHITRVCVCKSFKRERATKKRSRDCSTSAQKHEKWNVDVNKTVVLMLQAIQHLQSKCRKKYELKLKKTSQQWCRAVLLKTFLYSQRTVFFVCLFFFFFPTKTINKDIAFYILHIHLIFSSKTWNRHDPQSNLTRQFTQIPCVRLEVVNKP